MSERHDPATLRALADAVLYAIKCGCLLDVPQPRLGATVDELTKWGAMRNLHDKVAALRACADAPAQERPAAPAAPDAMSDAELDAIETRQRTEAVAFLRARHTPVAPVSDDTLRALADKLTAMRDATRPWGLGKREAFEVETIHKTLNVVLAEIAALRACADAQERPAAPASTEPEFTPEQLAELNAAFAAWKARTTPLPTEKVAAAQLSDETLRELAIEFTDRVGVADEMVAFARAVLARQQEEK